MHCGEQRATTGTGIFARISKYGASKNRKRIILYPTKIRQRNSIENGRDDANNGKIILFIINVVLQCTPAVASSPPCHNIIIRYLRAVTSSFLDVFFDSDFSSGPRGR